MIHPDLYKIHSSLDQTSTSYVYGEIYQGFIHDILRNMNCEYCRFVDIGSGSGNVLLELCNMENVELVGIEIDEDRYNESVVKLEKWCNVELIHNNFENIYFGNYDILYCCNCVFENEDNDTLYNKILREFKGKCFLFTYDNKLLPYYKKSFEISTSWVKKTELYYFEMI